MPTDTAAPTRDGSTTASPPTTVGSYLVDRLQALGVEHIFGIPGDYVLNLYKMLDDSPITVVGTWLMRMVRPTIVGSLA